MTDSGQRPPEPGAEPEPQAAKEPPLSREDQQRAAGERGHQEQEPCHDQSPCQGQQRGGQGGVGLRSSDSRLPDTSPRVNMASPARAVDWVSQAERALAMSTPAQGWARRQLRQRGAQCQQQGPRARPATTSERKWTPARPGPARPRRPATGPAGTPARPAAPAASQTAGPSRAGSKRRGCSACRSPGHSGGPARVAGGRAWASQCPP